MRKNNNTCILCSAINGTNKKNIENKVIIETDNFVVIPTIGQFIPGWLMVVSKHHKRCLLEHNIHEIDEATDLIYLSKKIINSLFGQAIVFEHGHGYLAINDAGCCVEHTHIHIAPCNYPEGFCTLIGMNNKECYSLSTIKKNFDQYYGYHLINTPFTGDLFGIYAVKEKIEKQYLRRILAVSHGRDKVWDWRVYPFYNNISKTINLLNNKFKLPIKLIKPWMLLSHNLERSNSVSMYEHRQY